jgi:hypothetical protein
MLRLLVAAVGGLALVAGCVWAFEVTATIRRIDAEKGIVVFTAGPMDRTARVAKGAKILDAKGKELADGLRAKDLQAGAEVTLTVEREDDKPVIKAIQLGKKTARAEPPTEGEKVDTSRLIALSDLGDKEYQGFQGGLYPDGKNERPASHTAAGLQLAKQIRPLDANGQPSADGKIVLLGVGFSNTVQAFQGFIQVAQADKEIDPKLVLVNGAVGGMSANMIQNPDDNGRGTLYWTTVDDRLKAAGVTRAQVQVVWIKETNPGPHVGGFPKYIQALQSELTKIVQHVHRRFPNVKQVFLSSRTYGGWARGRAGRGPGNSEPYSYETGFAVKWLLEEQLKGNPELNYDKALGKVTGPWLSWGPYLWANGTVARADGFRFELADFRDDDRMHESPAGQRKVGTLLLQFFKTDPTTRGWFVKKES